MRDKSRKLKKTGVIHDTITGYDFRVDQPLSPTKSIRVKCLECCTGSSRRVKKCPMYDCGGWPRRIGRGICVDPAGEIVTTKAVTDAQREAGRKLARNKGRDAVSRKKAV